MNIQNSTVPKWLSHYTTISELGRGAFSTVYKIKSNTNGNTYCLKKISLKTTGEKLNNEVMINQRLNHINLVKFCDSHIEEDYMYIIMEFCEYGDLYSLLRSVQKHKLYINEEILWDIAYQGLLALEYLHSKKVIHRDIKLLNIFMTKDKLVKIGDMGMSKLIDESVKMNMSRVGTPLYLAPELVKKEQYDYKIDIWSFGCSLYHLAKCTPPFNEENLIRLGNAIVSETPPNLPENYSQEFKYFVNLLMCKSKDVRPTATMALKLIPEKTKEKFIERFGNLIEKGSFEKTIPAQRKYVDSQSEGNNSYLMHMNDIKRMASNKKRVSESVNNNSSANDNLIGNAGYLIKRQFKFLNNKSKIQNATQDNFRPNSKEKPSIKTQTCNNFYNFNINVYKVNFNKKGNCSQKEDNNQTNMIEINNEKINSLINTPININMGSTTTTGSLNVFKSTNSREIKDAIAMNETKQFLFNKKSDAIANMDLSNEGKPNSSTNTNANTYTNKNIMDRSNNIYCHPDRLVNCISIDSSNKSKAFNIPKPPIRNKSGMNETNYPIFPLIQNKNSITNRNEQKLLFAAGKNTNSHSSHNNNHFNHQCNYFKMQKTTNKIQQQELFKIPKVLTIKDLK